MRREPTIADYANHATRTGWTASVGCLIVLTMILAPLFLMGAFAILSKEIGITR